MNKRYYNKSKTTIAKQHYSLLKYKNLIKSLSYSNTEISFIMIIKPSDNSLKYKVFIKHSIISGPKAWLIEPKLEKYNGKHPHHIFGIDECGNAQLCVFHRYKDKWNNNKLIANTFIPWVITWLNTYEYWLLTGEWNYDEYFRVNKTNSKCK